MKINYLSELQTVKERAIIINYNTKNSSFLALLSALRYANVPVLLIDCTSTDNSWTFFENALSRYHFDLISMPLRSHGETLDILFQELKDEYLLLIDSDLEILDERIITFLHQFIDKKEIFGSGFLNGPEILQEPAFTSTRLWMGLYYERPYMPITLMKSAYIRDALNSGASFAADELNNEFSKFPTWLQRVFRKTFHTLHIKIPLCFSDKFFECRPRTVYFDTGAKIYQFLRYKKYLFFHNMPEPLHPQYVTHFWGATRKALNDGESHTGSWSSPEELDKLVRNILKEKYNELI